MQQSQEELYHQIQQLKKHIEQLTSSHHEEKCSYNQRFKELSNKILQTENDKSSLVQVCTRLEADNSSLSQRLDEANHKLSTSEQEKIELQNRLEEVTRQQREMTNCLKKMREEVIDLTNVKYELLEVIENLIQENESLASQIPQSIERMSLDGDEERQNDELAENDNESNDDSSGINSLPDEVILEIFGYLKQKQLGQISGVCRRWNVLTRSPVLWKKVNVEISTSSTDITISLINRLPSCVTSVRIDFCYGHAKLDFLELCVRLQEMCPHLEELTFTYSVFSCIFSSAIDLCTQFLQDVKKLVFYKCIFPDCHSTSKFSGISKIEILDVLYCTSRSYCSLNKPPFSRMLHLKQLQLFGSLILGASWFDGDTSFLNQLHVLNLGNAFISSRTFSEIQNHGLNLKELCLRRSGLHNNDLNFDNSVFPQLVAICLTCCYRVTCEGVVSLIQSCQSLQNVYVDKNVADTFIVHPFVVANRHKSGIVKGIRCNHEKDAMKILQLVTF